jgi:hypothetical protein
MPGFKVCVSTLCDVRTTTKSPNDAFLRTHICTARMLEIRARVCIGLKDLRMGSALGVLWVPCKPWVP